MSTVHTEYLFECYFWRGVYYPWKVLSQLAFERKIQLSMQHPFECDSFQGVNYQLRVSVRMQLLARRLLFMQSTLATGVRTEHPPIYVEYPFEHNI